MAKLSHWCCDPRHGTPCECNRCVACQQECDPNAQFFGSRVQAEQKLARNQKAEQVPAFDAEGQPIQRPLPYVPDSRK